MHVRAEHAAKKIIGPNEIERGKAWVQQHRDLLVAVQPRSEDVCHRLQMFGIAHRIGVLCSVRRCRDARVIFYCDRCAFDGDERRQQCCGAQALHQRPTIGLHQ